MQTQEERTTQMVTDRNAAVLEAAVDIAERRGMGQVTREAVAEHTGFSTGTVSNAYGSMAGLRDEVMREAVKRGLTSIVAYGLGNRDPIAMRAPPDLKEAAAAALTS